MPVYVYRNLRTGETFEVEQRITEPALTEHPESGDPVKRLVQPVGIAFKGSGFYVTDSRGSSSKARSGKAEGSAESNGDGKPSTSDDTKAQAKSSGSTETAGSKDSASKKDSTGKKE